MRPLLVMFAPHEPERDPRIHWEASTAAREFDVFVLGLDEGAGKPPAETRAGYTILRSAETPGLATALRFAKRLHREAATPAERLLIPAALALAAPPFALLLGFRRTVRAAAALLDATVGRLVAPVPYLRRIRNVFCRLAAGTGLVARLIGLLGRRFPGLRLAGSLASHFARAGSCLLDLYLSTGLRADLVHANDLNALLPAVAVKRLHGARLVYDAHEFWPASVPEAPAWLVRALTAYERRLVPRADAVFTVTPALAAIMERRYRLPEVGVLPNAELLAPDAPPLDTGLRALARGRVVFLFQGNFAKERGLEELLRDWRSVDHTRAFLALRGPRWSYSEELERAAADLVAAGAVAFLPPVPEPDLVAASREADVGLIPYRPANLNNRHCCPNKLSQYLQAGLAILSNATSFVPAVLDAEGAGLAYDSDDPDSLPAAVRRLLDDPALLARMKANARRAGCTRWHWRCVAAPLMNTYRRLAARNGQRGGSTPTPPLEGHGPSRPPASPSVPSHTAFAVWEGTEAVNEVWGPRPQRGAGAEPRTFHLLGTSVRVDGEIDWSMGWIEGPVEAIRPRLYAGFPHNHLVRGDVKLPWELNKHLHFQEMAAEFVRTGDPRLAGTFMAQLDHWRAMNPAGWNLAWLEPLIVAHRLISWTLAERAFRPALDAAFMERLHTGVREHLLDLDRRYEFAAKASNHLIGNLCGAITGAAAHPEIPGARRILDRAVALLEDEVDRQILPDGAHYEMSTSYARVVLEFLETALDELARAGEPAPPRAAAAARRLAAFLDRLRRFDGTVPTLSDADGAKVYARGLRPHTPAGGPWALQTSRVTFRAFPHRIRGVGRRGNGERGLGPAAPAGGGADPRADTLSSAFLPHAGLAIFRDGPGENLLTFDAGDLSMFYDDDAPHGTHGHDDALSITLFARGRELVTDPGSGSYTGDLALHDALRVSTAHATFSLGPSGGGAVESHSIPRGPWTFERRARPLRAGAARAGAILLAAGAHDGYRRHPGAPVAARLVAVLPGGRYLLLDVAAPTASAPGETRVRWRTTFPFAPGAAVETDPGGFLARAGGIFLRGTRTTRGAAEWRSAVITGDETTRRGFHALDYGVVVPAPWAECEAEMPLPGATLWALEVGGRPPATPILRFDGDSIDAIFADESIRLTFAEGIAEAARRGFPRVGILHRANGSSFSWTGIPLDGLD